MALYRYKILHMPRQHSCRAMCKFTQRSLHHTLDESRMRFPSNLNYGGKSVREMSLGPVPPTCSAAWAFYQIRKIAGCACTGKAGNVFPATELKKKPLVSDPGMHHGTCFMQVLWWHVGIANPRWRGKLPGIPCACATRNFTYLVRGT